MLFKNEVFVYQDRRLRILEVTDNNTVAWVIDVEDALAWPKFLQYASIANLPAFETDDVGIRAATRAMTVKRDAAMQRIQPLVMKIPAVFVPQRREALINDRAHELGCSSRTLHKDLRRYWQGGQTPQALLSNYDRSGRSDSEVTGGRGRNPKGEHPTFQLQSSDVAFFREVIESLYLKDKRKNATDVYQVLLDKKYSYLDGNGKPFLKPMGEYPSIRQFRHFLKTNFTIEARLRAREGDKDFERDHRAKVGTIMADCLGVGHYYEIDATICDVYLVSTEDVNRIIGKPTYYLIIDRKSRLIVGFYIGLENASWICAMEAILSISKDKFELCSRYGVEYAPEDWPAHCVMPKEFLADRGELISHASSQIADNLGLTVTNVPGRRPDWKPLVECGFKLTHDAIHTVAPAYDPPSNATRRRGKHYEKDACLTLKDFGNLILNAIISHNRREIRSYPFDLKELTQGISSDPISLWNHGIISRSGLLSKYSEAKVRYALLPRDTATITAEGISFRGCFYTCAEAIAGGWFVKARKSTYQVEVSFDSRIVDVIYIHVPSGDGQPVRAELSPRSKKYLGLSVAEVKFYEMLRNSAKPAIEHSRYQQTLEFNATTKPIVDAAKKRLRTEGSKTSRTARRADIRSDRQIELSRERAERAAEIPNKGRPWANESAEVVSLSSQRRISNATSTARASSLSPSKEASAAVQLEVAATATDLKSTSLTEIAKRARETMFNG